MTCKQQTFNEIVGITTEGEIYLLNYLFVHSADLYGATGSILTPICQRYIDDRREDGKDDYAHLWRDAVATEQTECSLDEYWQQILDECDSAGQEFPGHDTGHVGDIPDAFKDEHFPDAVTFECIGGGRVFGREIQWATVLRPDLLAAIEQAEAGTYVFPE